MSVRKNGGPAFPQGEFSAYEPTREGMTLRDWFAGQALSGMLARVQYDRSIAAMDAYKFADAMLAERSKP